MEKSEFRAVIKHYYSYLKGKTVKETKEKLDKHYGEFAPSDFMVKYCCLNAAEEAVQQYHQQEGQMRMRKMQNKHKKVKPQQILQKRLRSYLILGKDSEAPPGYLSIGPRSIVIEWKDEWYRRMKRFQRRGRTCE